MKGGPHRDAHLPAVHCPFEGGAHPQRARLERRSLHWGVELRLVDAASAGRWRRARVAELAARTFPLAHLSDLQPISNWLLWSFAAREPARWAQLEAVGGARALLAVLEGRPPTPEDPISQGLASLREQLLQAGALPTLRRVAEAAGDWLATLSCHAPASPSLAERVATRRRALGCEPLWAFSDLATGTPLPAALWDDPAVRALRARAGALIAWAHDIFGAADRPLASAPDRSLVRCLQARHGLGLRDAIAEATRQHNDELARYVCEEQRLLEARRDLQLARLTTTLRRAVRGHLDWVQGAGPVDSCVRELRPATTPPAAPPLFRAQ